MCIRDSPTVVKEPEPAAEGEVAEGEAVDGEAAKTEESSEDKKD